MKCSLPTFRSVVLLAGVSISVVNVALAAPPNSTPPSVKEDTAFNDVHQKGISSIRNTDEVAQHLLRILKDEKAWPDHRVAAGQLLGRMRYFPALPALLSNINLTPTISGELSLYPLHVPVARFGNRAIPDVIEELLKQDLPSVRPEDALTVVNGEVKHARVLALYFSLDRACKLSDKKQELARIYLHGVAALRKDRVTKKRVEALLMQLDRWKASRRPAQRVP